MTVDDREDIIKIMGHAAGQLADGLHLLRLTQLIFQSLLPGHVPE